MLTWYINYYFDNPLVSLAKTKSALSKEFSKPKSDLQLVVGFKQITMRVDETSWELDQRLKYVIHEANMWLIDGQHASGS